MSGWYCLYCAVSSTRPLWKVAWTLSLNWTLSTESGMNQPRLTGRDKRCQNKHILDNLFSISYNSNFQSSACSSRNLLISLSRSFLISSGTIWLPFGATSYQIIFLNIFCAIFFLLYLDQVLDGDLVEAALLHHVLADPLHLVLPAALLQPLD